MLRELDLHGCTVAQAKQLLELEIARCPHGCELTVIHGCHGGTALQQFVRRYAHPRIAKRLLTLNAGETILQLK